MTDPRLTTLKKAREATIDALCRGFADEVMSLGELERRLETARAARTREELNRLLEDLPQTLPAPASKPPATRESAARQEDASKPARRPPVQPRTRESGHMAIAIMGGTRRAGRWTPPAEMGAIAIMGGVELDFRDAVLTEGVTEINCFAFWGGVEITVPPGVEVDSTGFALMGGFDQDAELETRPAPGAPVIRVNGFALMGAVEIKVAEPGSARKKEW